MNRILTADVILTLTAEQADVLLFALRNCERPNPTVRVYVDAVSAVVVEQCAKQGVKL